MLRRGFAPVTLVIAVAWEIWLLSGVTLDEILRFVGYEIGFVALPGVALLWALRGRPRGFLESVGLGIPLGHGLEILAFSATAAAGVRGLFLAYPIVVLALGALVVWMRHQPAARTAEVAVPMSSRVMWAAAAALSAGLIYLALMFIPQSPLPSGTASVAYSPDFVYQISKTAEVLLHWPPTNPGLSGVPLPYEWFLFFHMAAVSQVTHLGIPIIALRLDFVPIILVVGCQLLMIGRTLATAATGAIAIAVVFLLGPLDLTTDSTGSSPFFSVFGDHLWSSWTFPFGLIFFIALLYLLVERLRAASWRTRAEAGSWLLIALLMVGAAGAKATVLPVLLVGTGLYAMFVCVGGRVRPAPPLLVALALEATILVVTFLVIYRGGAPYTGLGPLASLNRTLPVIDASQSSMPGALRAIALPAAYAAGLLGMLLPLAGLLYMLRRRHRARLRRSALCLGMLGGGVIIANVFHQIGYSELYFQDTGYVAGCLVAADGLRLAWTDAGSALPVSRRAAVIAAGCWIAGLVALVVATSPARHPSQTAALRYEVLIGGCVVFVAGWWLLARTRHRQTTGLLGLGLIPILATSTLASPIEIAPTAGLLLSGIPIAHAQANPPTVRGMTPDLLAALQWLQAHSSVDTVIAVSNHWLDAAEQDGRYYYYSAFSDRQVFIEGYDASRYEIDTDPTTRAGADFETRQMLNNAVFGAADAASLHVMTHSYSVRFLLIDSQDDDTDDDNPAVVQLGTVVFSNRSDTIVEVG